MRRRAITITLAALSVSGLFVGFAFANLTASEFDITLSVFQGKFLSAKGQGTQTIGMVMKPDGTKVFVSDRGTHKVYQYSLATAWDMSTATYDAKSFSDGLTDERGLAFSSDGTKMYVSDDTASSITQYTVATPWDVSTASAASKTCSTVTQDSRPEVVTFNDTGSKMFILGSNNANKNAYRYNLSTPYDVSTCVVDAGQTFTFNSQTTTGTGFSFSSDGKRAILGGENQVAYSYTLSTAFDLTSMTYDSKSYADGTQVADPRNVYFSPDNNHWYIADSATVAVWEFSVCNCYARITSSAGTITSSAGIITNRQGP